MCRAAILLSLLSFHCSRSGERRGAARRVFAFESSMHPSTKTTLGIRVAFKNRNLKIHCTALPCAQRCRCRDTPGFEMSRHSPGKPTDVWRLMDRCEVMAWWSTSIYICISLIRYKETLGDTEISLDVQMRDAVPSQDRSIRCAAISNKETISRYMQTREDLG